MVLFGLKFGKDGWKARIEELLRSIETRGVQIMSAVSEFAAKQAAFNTQIAAAIDGIVGDVANLNAQILDLKDRLGQLSPEDQAALDALVVAGEALTVSAKAADDQTPPVSPPTP